MFSNRLYSEPFSFNFGAPKYYLDFFDSRKIRISVFYMREHTDLVYILQNRVDLGIVYISNTLSSEPISFSIGAPRYFLDILRFA